MNFYDQPEPDLAFNITQKKKKNKKPTREVPSEIYAMFEKISPSEIDRIFAKCNCNTEKTINELLQSTEPNQRKEIVQKEEVQFNFDYFGGESSYTQTEFQEKYNQINKELSQIIDINDEEYRQMMDECKQGIEEWLSSQTQDQINTDHFAKIQTFIQDIIQEKGTEFDDVSQFPFLPEQTECQYQNETRNRPMTSFNYDHAKHKPPPTKYLIRQLCEEFPQLSLDTITYSLTELQDYELAKRFLKKSYPSEFRIKKSNPINEPPCSKPVIKQSYNNINDLRAEFRRVRADIQDIQSNRTIVQACLGKHPRHINQQIYSHYSQQQREKLDSLYDRSNDLFVKIKQIEGFNQIDLHGFFGEEISDLLSQIFAICRLKQVEIIVGKGLHSKNKQSVLRPKVESYLKEHNYQYRVDDGKILVKL